MKLESGDIFSEEFGVQTRCRGATAATSSTGFLGDTPPHRVVSCEAKEQEQEPTTTLSDCQAPGCFVAPGGPGDYLIYNQPGTAPEARGRIDQTFYAWWPQPSGAATAEINFFANRYGIFGQASVKAGTAFSIDSPQYLTMSEDGIVTKGQTRNSRTVGIVGSGVQDSQALVHTAPVRMAGAEYIHLYRSVTLKGWGPFLLGIPVALANLAVIEKAGISTNSLSLSPVTIDEVSSAAYLATYAYHVSIGGVEADYSKSPAVPSTLFQHVHCKGRKQSGVTVTWTCHLGKKWQRYPEAKVDLGAIGTLKRAKASLSKGRSHKKTQKVVVLNLPEGDKTFDQKKTFTVTCTGAKGTKEVKTCTAAYPNAKV